MSVPQLPVGLPPLPEGAVYLGRGLEFALPSCGEFAGWRLAGSQQWRYSDTYHGNLESPHYAAAAGSEIARLNGHGVEPASEADLQAGRDASAKFHESHFPTKPAADSEAVALVRKLRDAIQFMRENCDTVFENDAPHHSALTEAAAFLAKEDTKS